MTLPVGTLPTLTQGVTPGAAPAGQEALHRVATEFEAILVRQLLQGSGVAHGAEGYADMAVDALAGGLTRTGGLGLARQLERALARELREIVPAGGDSPSSVAEGDRTQSLRQQLPRP
jgi:Rod binding domain-containing protein